METAAVVLLLVVIGMVGAKKVGEEEDHASRTLWCMGLCLEVEVEEDRRSSEVQGHDSDVREQQENMGVDAEGDRQDQSGEIEDV